MMTQVSRSRWITFVSVCVIVGLTFQIEYLHFLKIEFPGDTMIYDVEYAPLVYNGIFSIVALFVVWMQERFPLPFTAGRWNRYVIYISAACNVFWFVAFMGIEYLCAVRTMEENDQYCDFVVEHIPRKIWDLKIAGLLLLATCGIWWVYHITTPTREKKEI